MYGLSDGSIGSEAIKTLSIFIKLCAMVFSLYKLDNLYTLIKLGV